MEIRNLGRSGLRVSAIGLGCNNFGGRIDLASALGEGTTFEVTLPRGAATGRGAHGAPTTLAAE